MDYLLSQILRAMSSFSLCSHKLSKEDFDKTQSTYVSTGIYHYYRYTALAGTAFTPSTVCYRAVHYTR